MKHLTTRKIICVLIGFVLALGMQNTADAISRLTRSSGDLQTVTAGRDYQIRFTVSLQSPRRGSAYTDHVQTPSADVTDSLVADKRNKTTYYEDDYDPSTDPVTGERGYQSETQVTYDTAHDYEQEQIAITVSGGALKRVGSHDASGTSLTMYESTHNSYSTTSNPHQRLSGSVALTLTAPTTAAIVTITIDPTTDATPHTEPPDLTFTIYVVGPLTSAGTTVVASGSTDSVERVSDQQDTRIDGHFTFGPTATNQPVYYIVEGSGRLYVSPAADGVLSPVSDRKTSPTNNLYTSSSAPVFLDTNGGSSKVTAYIAGSGNTAKVLYVFSGARLSELPQIEAQSGDNQTGAPSGRLDDYFEVRVTDGRRRPISGLPVTFATTAPTGSTAMFIPVPGTRIYTDATFDGPGSIDAERPTVTVATSTNPAADDEHLVQTDRNGVAKIYYQLSSTSGAHRVTADAYGIGGISTTLTATASSSARARLANLEIVSGNNQRGEKGKYLKDDLIVIVRSLAGHRVQNAIIQFRTTAGTLVPAVGTTQPATVFGQNLETDTTPSPLHPRSGQQIYVQTGPNGEAGVSYNVGQVVEARDVIAEIREEAQTSTQYDFAIDRVVFNINGTGSTSSRDTSDTSNTEDPANTFAPLTLIVGQTSIEGAPGSTQQLTITASETAQVGNIVFGEFLNAGGSASPTSGSGTFTSTLTLPSTEGEYDLVVNMGTERRTVTVTVSRTTASDTQTGGQIALEVPVSGAPNSSQSIRVTVINAAGGRVPDVEVTLSITSGGGTFSNSRVTTGPAGTATSQLTLGSTPGNNYVVTATATNYPSVEKRISITGTQPPTGDTSEQRAAGEAAAIDVYDGDGQRGVPNARLSELLVVEVTDANGNPVSGERVTFRTTIGSGRFSPARPRTNGGGRAQTWFTPTSSGTLRIAASVDGVSARAVFRVTTGAPPASLTKVSGDSQSGTPGDALANPFVVEVKDADGETIEGVPVAFSVTAGGGRLSETSATTDRNGRAETTLTLGSRVGINSVEARVSGVDPVTFNTSIEPEILVAAANRPVMYWIDGGALYRLAGAKATQIAASANGIAVGGGKVYWTATTGASAGTINAANLDGSGAKVLTRIMAVPMGIAVDTADSKLYWTNARGRIQSANLDGSGIRNVIQNLSSPTDLVVSNGFIYWTENDTAIKRVNLKGQKQVQDVAVRLSSVGGLAVGGGKVYWTEQTSASAGTVNGANLNGTQFETLATLLSAPMGIAVDTTGSKLYWTNARGRIQSANLDGSGIRNVVKGLIAPSKLAIGDANAATATPTATQPMAKKDTSAYDVNGDGKVDNVDASLVASGLDTGNAKYDVNKDGTVNFLDLLLIFDNRDADAAGAPTVVGMQLTTVQRDRIEAQIDLLIATNDRSPAAMRTLVYLQQLLVTARPEKTQLLANYPNPFNPETWIPYELATDTDVRITIYNAQGVVIRTLQLGQQSAGYYTDREQAAYWDGRNAFGERVASGVYFYQLETDEMSSLRKMVILK